MIGMVEDLYRTATQKRGKNPYCRGAIHRALVYFGICLIPIPMTIAIQFP